VNLTGKQLVEQGIITGQIDPENIQQVGVDLNLIKVERIVYDQKTLGFVPKSGKTLLAKRESVELQQVKIQEKDGSVTEKTAWVLQPGSYDITLKQGCVIPSNQRLRIVQRSSLLRNGAVLSSSMFDPGFSTSNIGTVLLVSVPLIIEFEARVAQAYTSVVNEVEKKNLYNGQWQSDNQRKQA
jgi:deoxycytidine triphosphate deaminase